MLVLTLLLAAAATVAFTAGSVDRQQGEISALNTLAHRVQVELHDAVKDERAAIGAYILTRGADRLAEFEDAEDLIIEVLSRLDTQGDAELSGLVAEVRARHDRWADGWVTAVREQRGMGFAVDGKLILEGSTLQQETDVALRALDAYVVRQQAQLLQATDATATRGVLMILVVLGGLVVALGAIAAIVLRSVTTPLERLIEAVDEARRTGHAAFDVGRPDEIGALARTLQGLHEDLAARYASARREADRASLYSRLSERLTSTSDEAEITRIGSAVLARLIPYASGNITLLNPSANRLTVAVAWGDGQPAPGERLLADPKACPAMRRSASYIVRDTDDQIAERCGVMAVGAGYHQACLPMIASGNVVGVLHLRCPADVTLDESAPAQAQRVSEQLGLAIANSRLTRTMERLAMTDPMTGLANARSFDSFFAESLRDAQASERQVGVIFLDLDHFKAFNDTYGHPAGDEALRALGATITPLLREADFVARYGGEEFVVAIRDADLAATAAVAEKIRHAVSQMVVVLGPDRFARVSASLGVAATDVHGFDAATLIRTADAALYRAKAAGRNRVVAGAGSPALGQPSASDQPAGPGQPTAGQAGATSLVPERRGRRGRRQALLPN